MSGHDEETLDEQVVRDAEASLVAALQESDTAMETFQDAELDSRSGAASRRWTITIAGLALAALGLVVARRRS